jgi:hypothetical protein
MLYVLDFGSANAGGSPAWTLFTKVSDGSPAPQPVINEMSGGLYSFTFTLTYDVAYRVELNGVELSDVLPGEPGVGGDASGRFKTAGDILNRAASEVGLAEVTDPYVSSDPNFVQMRRLLQSAAGDLLNVSKPWPQLIKEFSIATVAGDTHYDVPSDFRSMIDGTGWNRTTRRMLGGPASPQQYQKLVAWRAASTLTVVLRLTPLEIIVYPTPPDGIVITGEYVSKNWVQSANAVAPDSDAPTSKDDLVLFDDLLVVRALKLKFLQAKGFDTTVALADYASALEAAVGRSGGAPILTTSRRVLPAGSHTVAEGAGAADPFGAGILY